MKTVRTGDGSFTFYSEEYDETYHSTSGALEEAQKKFIEPCKIKEGMKILDIGFGLGYNIGMALQASKKLRIVSLEKDPFVLRSLSSVQVPYWFINTYSIIKSAASHLEYHSGETHIDILMGDAKETIRNIILDDSEKFDAVFLDPFSPSKNSELWSVEFFKEIKKRMKKGAIMATYSCAGQVRRNLKEAGFNVLDGPIVGRRSPGTLAVNFC